MTDFKTHDQEEHRKSLADFLPSGNSFSAKNNPSKNLFKLLYGMVGENVRAEDLLVAITEDYDITQTTFLIDLWEDAVGIPDSCFKTEPNVDIDFRRKQVLFKMTCKADTRLSFIEIANFFGYQCRIVNGLISGLYPLPYPWTYFASYKEARFTMIVELPAPDQVDVYPFNITKYPWPYSSDKNALIECLFRKIARANVQVIFRYILT